MLQVHWTDSSPLQDIEYQHLEGIPFDLTPIFRLYTIQAYIKFQNCSKLLICQLVIQENVKCNTCTNRFKMNR